MHNFYVNQCLREHIRTVPDWPAPGVQFRDITPLPQDARVFRILIDAFVHRYMSPAMMAGKTLIEKLSGIVMECVAIVDLLKLGGSAKLRAGGLLLFTLVDFGWH